MEGEDTGLGGGIVGRRGYSSVARHAGHSDDVTCVRMQSALVLDTLLFSCYLQQVQVTWTTSFNYLCYLQSYQAPMPGRYANGSSG